MIIKYITVVLVAVLFYVTGDDDTRSLTFVIDETKSMYDDIQQVNQKTHEIFNAVRNSSESQIDEFIIVTFNDFYRYNIRNNDSRPDAKLLIIAKNETEFRKALNDIKVDEGGDCPEMALTGIEMALEHSKPNSYLYVFTDAAAKDYNKLEQVKSLSQRKMIQITFLLTGDCKNVPNETHVVYDKLAAATSGQVFHIGKQDVEKIIEYIIASIQSQRTTLARKTYERGCDNEFRFTVDSKVRFVLISVSAEDPVFRHVIGPGGVEAMIEEFVHTNHTYIVKLKGDPGEYAINITNCGETSIVVTASTSIRFKYGFSSTKPNSLDETSTKPISDKQSYLAIKLDNIEKDVTLDTVELRDIDDKVIKQVPLKLTDEDNQFYTTELFDPPKIIFKIATIGYTKTKEKIIRVSPTTVEFYKPEDKEKISEISPAVSILAKDEAIAEYDKPVTLKCKIKAFPEPKITWEDQLHTVLPSTADLVDPPYGYISTLTVANITQNATFICKANNGHEDSDSIQIILKKKTFLNVLEYPTDVTVLFGSSVEFNFKLDASPPATIVWYEKNKTIENNDDFELSSDSSVLKIKNVQLRLGGTYFVEASNGDENKKYEFKVIVGGTEKPIIDKNITIYTRDLESNVDITCRVIQGKPKPLISWEFYNNNTDKFVQLSNTNETIHIDEIGINNMGTYRCRAFNEIGMDIHDMLLIGERKVAETRPSVTILEKNEVLAEYDKPVTLKCKVEGIPEPKITWEDELNIVWPSTVELIDPPYVYVSTLQIEKITRNATFICKANNGKEDSDSIQIIPEYKTFIHVLEYPTDVEAVLDKSVELNLKINSFPRATIIWYENNKTIENNDDFELSSDSSVLKIKNVQLRLGGTYFVEASNGHENIQYTFTVTVVGTGKVAETRPSVTILEKNEVLAEYDKPVTLKCKVEGIPEPKITWEDELNIVWPSTVELIDPPYVYVSTLQIEKITRNATFICKANNGKEDSDSIQIIPEYKTFIHVLEYPTDVEAVLDKSVELNLKINSFPRATIIWYENNKTIENNEDFEISSDNSVLKIKSVQPKLGGTYFVEASNGHENIQYTFTVTLVGTEKPIIDKNITQYIMDSGSNMDIICRIVRGKPKPVISWEFDYNNLGKFVSLSNTNEIFHFYRVKISNSGTYRCMAVNEIGTDVHYMQLYVQYSPTVHIKPRNMLSALKGERVKLDCIVEGIPAPTVKWLKSGTEIKYSSKYTIFANKSLSFIGTRSDAGAYICEATNKLNTTRKSVEVVIYEPVEIKTPKRSVYNVTFRNPLTLFCRATGYPIPSVRWFYQSFGAGERTQLKHFENRSLEIKEIWSDHEGLYTCIASNRVDQANITYQVNVPVGASIYNFESTKLEVVVGDPQLKLSCLASGSPKPTITWTTNGFTIGTDSGLYQTESNGNLILNNITMKTKGTYICKAENSLGTDILEYEVNVNSYPIPKDGSLDVLLTQGTTKPIPCNASISLEDVELVRWFKDGILLNTVNLTLFNVTKADAGYYSCRVSTKEKSFSFHKRVIVGTRPNFIINVKTPKVKFEEGALAVLDCSATGYPPPKTKWLEGRNILSDTSESYTFNMTVDKIKLYKCIVSNEFGTIDQTFDVTGGECLLDLKDDLTALQPLLLEGGENRTRAFRWPKFETSEGFLEVPKYRDYRLVCPDSFVSYGGQNYGMSAKTSCLDGTMFELGGKNASFSEIVCNTSIIPIAKQRYDKKCSRPNEKSFLLGYEINKTPIPALLICFNSEMKIPVLIKHTIPPAFANTVPKDVVRYFESSHINLQLEDIYNCRNQLDAIPAFTFDTLKKNSTCCFSRRQLVNPKDVRPGMFQVATYHYLNVVPQWSTCGTENWDEVERRVRSYALDIKENVVVWTGTSNGNTRVSDAIFLKDDNGQKLQVPKYIWKVIENQLAVVHINVPGLTPSQATDYIICKDICNTVDWMKSEHWHDIDKGYIYCCDIEEFASAFNYINLFDGM